MNTLVDHSAGNYRLLMIMGGELLAYGMANEIAQLDEKGYLEVYQPRSTLCIARRKRGCDDGLSSEQMLPVVRVADLASEEIAERWLVEELWVRQRRWA